MLGAITRRSVFATGLAPALRCSATPLFTAKRFITTQSVTPKDSLSILNNQREKRPTSPHLAIYQPQVTWILSGLNRNTGVLLSGGLYVFSLAYLLNGYIPVDSAHLVQFVHDLPAWFRGSVKMVLAGSFTFHFWNGIRHLLWDTGYGLTLKGVYAGAYTVMAATAVSTVYLVFFV